jgi:hypothetical protein
MRPYHNEREGDTGMDGHHINGGRKTVVFDPRRTACGQCVSAVPTPSLATDPTSGYPYRETENVSRSETRTKH